MRLRVHTRKEHPMKLFSNGRTVVPETSIGTPSHDELVIRVNVLAGEIARLTRELRALQTAPVAASTVGPVPSSPEDAKSPRALYRYIAVRDGKNEDTVRQSIARGAAFGPLRERYPDLAQNMRVLRIIATGTHYAEIMSGAAR